VSLCSGVQKTTYVILVLTPWSSRELHAKPWEPVPAHFYKVEEGKSSLSGQNCACLSTLLGSYNKAFCLTLDDSLRVIARLPCPLAGPSYLVTASEVATLHFAREVLKLPVPRVITWSGTKRGHLNPVGADYIIMEEVPGVPLGDRWKSFETADEVRPIMTGVLDAETKLTCCAFPALEAFISKKTSAQSSRLSPSSRVPLIPLLDSCQKSIVLVH